MGDGVNRRARSRRNKIVGTLSAIATTAAGLETALPGVLPPGSGVTVSLFATFLATLVNQFYPN